MNRLLIPFVAEGIRMAERGDAEPKDIDTAMKLGAGVSSLRSAYVQLIPLLAAPARAVRSRRFHRTRHREVHS